MTLAEALHAAGYATLIAGKWHLGLQDQHWPEYQGFDVNFGGYSQGGPFGGKQYFSPYGNPRLADGPPGEHLTDRLAAETIRFIEARRHKPFFAYVPFYDVHVPLVAKEELRQKYERKRNPFGETKSPIWGFDGEVRVRQVQEHAIYAAMVEAMDQAVGRILETIERLGLSERTIVVFTSDNGGLSTGDVSISADQGWPTSNRPLRAGKGWLYEGGIRVPLIIRAPSVTPQGAVSETVVTGMDFFPTLLELAELSRDGAGIDGVSLVSSLRGKKQERGPVFWHYPHYGNQGGRPGSVVRDAPWKLIHWYGESTRQLFNLAKDIGETKDLASQEPETRDRLSGLLDSWLRSMDAKFPTPR